MNAVNTIIRVQHIRKEAQAKSRKATAAKNKMAQKLAKTASDITQRRLNKAKLREDLVN